MRLVVVPAVWTVVSLLLVVTHRVDVVGVHVGFVLAFAGVAASIICAAAIAARVELSPVAATVAAVLLAPLAWLGWHLPFPEDLQPVVAGLGLLLPATLVGVALGRGARDPAHMWPLVLVAIGADVASVTLPGGPTQALVDGTSAVSLHYVALCATVPGGGVGPLIGVGDIAFTSLMLGACARLGFSLRGPILGASAGFGVCLLALLVVQLPLPALPFIAPAVAATLGERARPRAKELLLAGGVVLALVAISFLLGGRSVR